MADLLVANLVRVEWIKASNPRHDAGRADQLAGARVLEHEKILLGPRRLDLLGKGRLRPLQLRLEETVLVGQRRQAAPIESVGDGSPVRANGGTKLSHGFAGIGRNFAQPNHAGGDVQFVITLCCSRWTSQQQHCQGR